jgi:hypothetical protein
VRQRGTGVRLGKRDVARPPPGDDVVEIFLLDRVVAEQEHRRPGTARAEHRLGRQPRLRVAEQRLHDDQVLDGAAALAAVLLGHRDAKKTFRADPVEDLAVRRLVRLVPFAGLVGERSPEFLGARLQILLLGCQGEVHRHLRSWLGTAGVIERPGAMLEIMSLFISKIYYRHERRRSIAIVHKLSGPVDLGRGGLHWYISLSYLL